jgi:hypothetical protein
MRRCGSWVGSSLKGEAAAYVKHPPATGAHPRTYRKTGYVRISLNRDNARRTVPREFAAKPIRRAVRTSAQPGLYKRV